MKCSKCGEECSENQAFCLKCGNPIEVIPDLNIIEEELANNVGELMDEIREEEKTKELFDKAKHIYGNAGASYDSQKNREDELKVNYVDTLSGFKPIQLDDEFEEEIKIADLQREHNKKNKHIDKGFTVDSAATYKKDKRKQEEQAILEEKKLFKIRITCAIIAIFVIIIIAIVVIMWPTSKVGTSSFKKHYDKGLSYYNAGNYTEAAKEYNVALNSTGNQKSMKKVLSSLLDVYKKIEGSDSDIIEVLKEMIKLEPDKIDYYEELLELYDKNGMINEIDALIKSVEGTGIAAQLTGYSFTGPEFNYESGSYDQYLYISLSNSKGYKMYYTTDGSTPSASSTEYTEPFEIANEGDTVVKAISINEKGISSSVVEKKFTIALSSLVPPTVTPDSGKYDSVQQITVSVPAGMKAYYTFDEGGAAPTTSSDEYTGPIDMPSGKTLFSVILVNEQGVSSSVTQKLYELNVKRTYTYNQALDSLKTNMISRGLIADSEGNTASGEKVEFSYVGVQVMKSEEYYVIKTTSGELYGVGTVNGLIKTVAVNEKGEYEIVD